ncbi:uncharacterized protein A4U43_C08F19870 [Asparagus officinalis]|uniref:uncharacterized protein LOC109822894 n=1 Tax=Asparagus officinalis TaxID=4686 RepID=UPI00098E3CAA|nr:uncharacterized protein LOC109822894 [Asparagus officinalis]ONK60560.1 uncharacterized protein A4U43_C08F19870 [Asparagus officinalis]
MALRWFLGIVTTQIVAQPTGDGSSEEAQKKKKIAGELKATAGVHCGYEEGFRMPLRYPRYKKEDYERMEEWRVDNLLMQYGLACEGSVEEKRAFAMGTFLWPDQF